MLHRGTLWLQRNDVCWRCQWRLARRPQPASNSARNQVVHTPVARPQQSALYATASRSRHAAVVTGLPPQTIDPAILDPTRPIRQRLEQWQEDHGRPNEAELRAFENFPASGDVGNYTGMLKFDAGPDDTAEDAGRNDQLDPEREEMLTVDAFLKPGDVAEINVAGHEPMLAVFVQQLDHRAQFFSGSGRWCHAKLNQIEFAIPRCISPALIDPLLPYLPTKPEEIDMQDATIHAPTDLAAPVVQALQAVGHEAEEIYRRNASVLDGAYSVLADQSRTRMMTLQQTARTLLAPGDRAWTPSSAVLVAIRRALFRNAFRFGADTRSHRLTNVFSIRPKADVEVVETVHDWIRQYQEYQALLTKSENGEPSAMSDGAVRFKRFVEKARRIVALSRQHRDPLFAIVGPSKVGQDSSSLRTQWGEEFNSTDKRFVSFLIAWALHHQFQGSQGLHSACCFLLHSIGLYTNIPASGDPPLPRQEELDVGSGHLLLQELGVLGPHENETMYNETLMLPTVRMSRNLEMLNSKAELTRLNPDFRDAMSHLRRDWGKLEVYCIDDADAQEIDDGISIEEIGGNAGGCWIHAHIANPTAFFDKTHVLSGLAAHMTQTLYTPERTYPMLPTWASQKYFSLDRNRPVLTFSTRVDSTGQIVERKIQPGIVRQLTRLTYVQLRELMGEAEPVPSAKLVVGSPLPSENVSPSRRHTPLSSNQLQELQRMSDVAQKLQQRRRVAGGITMNRTVIGVRVFGNARQKGYPFFPVSTDRSRIIHGDPTIEVTCSEAGDTITDAFKSSDIVPELMMASCETAGIWCSERNIPVMFRGTRENPRMDVMSFDQLQKQVIEPYLAKHGKLSHAIELRLIAAMGTGVPSTTSIAHRFLGVDSYVKVTSPLRRFGDMIAHWQIEAALRYEAATGQKFSDSNSKDLAFSQRQMQEALTSMYPREQLIRRSSRWAELFWTTLAFSRAYYYKEAKLPDTFQVTVHYVPPGGPMGTLRTIGYLKDYAVQVDVEPCFNGEELKLGDVWECKINHINGYVKTISVQATKLLSRDPEA
ncbi:RNB-domain-containing protein [Lophiostoma macrostomum CBS 122681]|uniref:RNB-domain-containing protein n=1 Tax=Lophiostoma macrostomum CBS 122681 TaxID=1314788 RepID=A0A6A6TTU2_9PLEO|nr:RNB-domain-containing protein [Lophiostoma macrostomum CBS 122681]